MDLPTTYLVLIFWLPGLLVFARNILWDVYFWQIKEYRYDRLYTHIRYDNEPSQRQIGFTVLKLLLFIVLATFVLDPLSQWLAAAVIAVFFIYCLESISFIESIIAHKFVRPKLSVRNLLALAVSFTLVIIMMLLISLPLLRGDILTGYQQVLLGFVINNQVVEIPTILVFMVISALVLISFDLGSPVISTIAVTLTYPVAFIRRYLMIRTAKTIMQTLPNMKIIAVTGNYGKTTTKEIIYELVKDSFKTVRTAKNYNSNLGVSQTIINDLRPDTELFISEVGTYRRGEIKEVMQIIKPDIGIVTNVEYAHIGIHGSQERISAAKYELLEGLKSDGVAILNGDDAHCLKMAERNEGNEILFFATSSKQQIAKVTADDSKIQPLLLDKLVAEDIKVVDKHLEFNLHTYSEQIHIKTAIHDKHLIHNLLAAIAAALTVGVELELIRERLLTLQIEGQRLTTLPGENDTTVIDDMGNSNYTSFKIALAKLLELPNSSKVVITKGIYELGKYKTDIYHKLAQEFSDVELVITTDAKLRHAIFTVSPQTKVVYARSNEEIIYNFRSRVAPGAAVLLEGKLRDDVVNAIVSKDN